MRKAIKALILLAAVAIGYGANRLYAPDMPVPQACSVQAYYNQPANTFTLECDN